MTTFLGPIHRNISSTNTRPSQEHAKIWDLAFPAQIKDPATVNRRGVQKQKHFTQVAPNSNSVMKETEKGIETKKETKMAHKRPAPLTVRRLLQRRAEQPIWTGRVSHQFDRALTGDSQKQPIQFQVKFVLSTSNVDDLVSRQEVIVCPFGWHPVEPLETWRENSWRYIMYCWILPTKSSLKP